jgi:uncharacterized membrane protein
MKRSLRSSLATLMSALTFTTLGATSALAREDDDRGDRQRVVTYRVVQLATDTNQRAIATALNNRNVVLGQIGGAWSLLNPDGTTKILSTLTASFEGDINDRGNAVFTTVASDGTNTTRTAYLYAAASGSVTPLLGDPPPGETQTAVAIDNANTVYGVVLGAANRAGPYKIEDGQFVSLVPALGTSVMLMGANRSGVIVGQRSAPFTEPFRYDTVNNVLTNLTGALGSPVAVPRAINASGLIVGVRNAATQGPSGFVLDNQSVVDVTLPGAIGAALSRVNRRGDAVGQATFFVSPNNVDRAMLWRRGTAVDLSALPEVVASGWALTRAIDINDRGTIVCTASRNGVDGTVLLIPIAN